jgi:hypothetical protein
MAELNREQLEGLDLIIEAMARDKVATAQISADYTDAIADAVVAAADVINQAVDAYVDAIDQVFGGINQAVEAIFGDRVVLAADQMAYVRERLDGRPTPSLEELVALRQLHRG